MTRTKTRPGQVFNTRTPVASVHAKSLDQGQPSRGSRCLAENGRLPERGPGICALRKHQFPGTRDAHRRSVDILVASLKMTGMTRNLAIWAEVVHSRVWMADDALSCCLWPLEYSDTSSQFMRTTWDAYSHWVQPGIANLPTWSNPRPNGERLEWLVRIAEVTS